MTKYLKINPRGFANEFVVLRVPADKVTEAEAQFADFEDDTSRGGFTNWVAAPLDPLDAVDWVDRGMVL